MRTCVPNLGAVRRERFLTINNPLNPPLGWGGSNCLFKVRVSIRTCVPNLGAVRRNRSPKSEALADLSTPSDDRLTSDGRPSIRMGFYLSRVGWVRFF